MNLPENELRGYIQDNGKAMWTAHNNHNIRYFKEEEVRVITNNYGTLIGKGAFGEVYRGVLDDKSSVAVKRYINDVKENFAKEMIVHCHINHRNVVRLIGCCMGESALMMVTEYISKGNLSDILHCNEISISLETRLGIAIGCAEALSYMHSQMYGQVIHGDIKPANILLDENLDAKISDFGISKLLSTDKTLYTTYIIGSIGYMDPLFARSGRLTSKSDVYSFGVVLLELITRRKAIDDDKISLAEIFTQALAKRKKIRDLFDVEIADDNNLRILERIGKLAAKCLEMDIDKRPEMKDVAEELRILRKSQYQKHEKVAFFGWARRRQYAAQNTTPGNKLAVRNTARGNSLISIRNGIPLEQVDLEDLLRAECKLLGEGKYGTTFKAVLENGAVFTVKRSKVENVAKAVFEERIEAIGAIEHELIVPLRGYFFSKDEKLLIYNYFGNGSLSSNLHGSRINKVEPVGWETRSAIALSSARVVAYIHSTNANASHGNIKSSNILLTGSYEARISEHGINTLVRTPTSCISYSTAPEVKDTQNVSQKADVYSFGVLLLELLTGVSPCPTQSSEGHDLVAWIMAAPQEQRATRVLDQKLLKDNGVVDDMLQFLQLATHCCEKRPNSRPVMSEVVQKIEEIQSSTVGNR